jgi:hypothetical protein
MRLKVAINNYVGPRFRVKFIRVLGIAMAAGMVSPTANTPIICTFIPSPRILLEATNWLNK